MNIFKLSLLLSISTAAVYASEVESTLNNSHLIIKTKYAGQEKTFDKILSILAAHKNITHLTLWAEALSHQDMDNLNTALQGHTYIEKIGFMARSLPTYTGNIPDGVPFNEFRLPQQGVSITSHRSS